MSDPTANSSTQPLTTRRPGRPVGTYKHRKDNSWLGQAARFVNTGHAASARQAFAMLTGDDDTAIRRLQRRWEKDGEELLRMDRICHTERCELEYRSLRESFPALWARIAQFVGSIDGKRFLGSHARADGHSSHPMAIGMGVLIEGVEAFEAKLATREAEQARLPYERRPQKDPTDNSQANQLRFDRALEGWFTGNLPITPVALRALAERAQKLADDLETDLQEGTR